MRLNEKTLDDRINNLLRIADNFDKNGHYKYADYIYDILSSYLSPEIKLELKNRHNKLNQDQSMSSSEFGRGFMYLRGGDLQYQSGKGQQCFKDNLPMNVHFN